jgi:ubiquinone/menaquinone biosynthesis C-methylase UbiE
MSQRTGHPRPSLFIAVLLLITACGGIAQTRQPAPVMTADGADWLIRPERIEEEQPDRMLAALDIKPGSTVADVGAGIGYHAWRLAKLVGPSGKVLAEDIQPEMLRMLRQNISDRKLTNVQPILGTEKDPKLPAGQVDLVLMVDVYHEFADPTAMMQAIRRSLKADGRVVLVEFRKEDPNVPIRPEHKMTTQQVRNEIEPLGFKFEKVLDFLPWQHILFFSKAK